MTVTAKEEREIVAECTEPPEEAVNGEAAPQAAGDAGEAAPQTASGVTQEELNAALAEALDAKLSPIEAKIDGIAGVADAAAGNIAKVLDLYDTMVEQRNKATLLLTKHIEMYERIKSLADYCRDSLSHLVQTNPEVKSAIARSANMERIAQRTLGSFGVLPVWPAKNDAFDEHLHQIISDTAPASPDDVPGAIAECLKMGVVRDGVVAKAAEVVVFKTVENG